MPLTGSTGRHPGEPEKRRAHYFRALANWEGEKTGWPGRTWSRQWNWTRGSGCETHSGGVYLRERNQDLARQQIDAALKMAPQDVRVLMLHGGLKMLQKDTRSCRTGLQQDHRDRSGLCTGLRAARPGSEFDGAVARRPWLPSTKHWNSIRMQTDALAWLSATMFGIRSTTRP
jgi:hypothetical protein